MRGAMRFFKRIKWTLEQYHLDHDWNYGDFTMWQWWKRSKTHIGKDTD